MVLLYLHLKNKFSSFCVTMVSYLTIGDLLKYYENLSWIILSLTLGTYNDLNQMSHYCKGLSVREVMSIENMMTQVKFS